MFSSKRGIVVNIRESLQEGHPMFDETYEMLQCLLVVIQKPRKLVSVNTCCLILFKGKCDWFFDGIVHLQLCFVRFFTNRCVHIIRHITNFAKRYFSPLNSPSTPEVIASKVVPNRLHR